MRIAIANRGEVAVRIIRACQERGYTSVLLHSTADIKTPAYRMANETVEIKGFSPTETYLDIDKVIAAAEGARCDFLHPGFGFLSENADFVERLEKTDVKFIGPTSDSIRLAGNKISAKELAISTGIPTVPSYTGAEKDAKKLLAEVKKIGFPCIIKAASGGGGKGMKVARSADEFFELYESARREAKNAFGSDIVFIEKYLERPKHIEVQVAFDKYGNGLHFFERECSIQRRHQKIFEETPSTSLTPELRHEITQAALSIAARANYLNAGTVEFLLDASNNFYFMELNTRLQVEHTVTELVCGVDFVQLQFDIAEGKAFTLSQDDIHQRGHAMEVRLYSENPDQDFLPSTGEISTLTLPLGPNRRFDFGYDVGDEITPYYDPMIGKIITWSATREQNLKRMYATLSEIIIFGVHTNIEFLKDVLKTPSFQRNDVSTSFLSEQYKDGFKLPPLTKEQEAYAKTALASLSKSSSPSSSTSAPGGGSLGYESPWSGTKLGGAS